MKRFTAMMAVVVILVAIALPAVASAATQHTTVVSTVSGVQIAEQLAGQLKGVQIGSAGATVTLDANGKAAPVHIEFPEMGKTMESGSGGWMTFAAVPVVGTALVKVLSFLARLGGR